MNECYAQLLLRQFIVSFPLGGRLFPAAVCAAREDTRPPARSIHFVAASIKGIAFRVSPPISATVCHEAAQSAPIRTICHEAVHEATRPYMKPEKPVETLRFHRQAVCGILARL